ncbi:MAG: DUF3618 domain-containing protein [Caldilineaceae bacterium]
MTNHHSSDEIRQDIRSTRAGMSETLDAIQSQLHPDNLKNQAQEVIRSSMTEGANAVVNYLSTNRSQIGSTVTQAIKRNPVPAALVGLGVGWLLMEGFGDNNPRGNSAPERGPGMGYGSQSMHPYRSAAYSRPSPAPYTTAAQAPEDSRIFAGRESVHDSVAEANGHVQEAIGSAADSLRHTASQIGESVHDTAENVADQLHETAEQARARAEAWSKQAGNQTAYLGENAQQYVQRTGRQVQHTIEDNPVLFGAVAFGVGALIAMMLPETRRENEWMGEAREQVLDTAKEAAQNVAQRAQTVVEEAAPEVQRSVEKIVDEVTQTGKQLVDEVKSTATATAQATADEVKTAAKGVKSTAESVAKEAKEPQANAFQ